MTNLPGISFHLNEFYQVGRWIDEHVPSKILAWVLKSFLWGLEDRYITAKASASVSKAIREFEESDLPEGWEEGLTDDPRYYSEPSEIPGFPVIGIRTNTADQIYDSHKSDTSSPRSTADS